jgi:arylformamidase
MSFDDLPPLPPQVNPDAQAYIDRVCALSRAAYKTARGEFDIPYGHDYWQKVDVFAPPTSGQQKLPVLCFMHGGAWVSGSKEWMATGLNFDTPRPLRDVLTDYKRVLESIPPTPMPGDWSGSLRCSIARVAGAVYRRVTSEVVSAC